MSVLSEGQFGDRLYHGTVARMRPGDVVLPLNHPDHPGSMVSRQAGWPTNADVAYATTDPSSASSYAEGAWSSAHEEHPGFAVYEVRPLGAVRPDANVEKFNGAYDGDVESPDGFEVVAQHQFTDMR